MLENQMSRWGAISKSLDMNTLPPGAKLFLVSDSDDTTVGPVNLGAEFPVDKDGVARVYTTIQAAVNAATANRGDVILVLPGYSQNVGATGDSWNKAGVTIMGIGYDTAQPTLNYNSATGTIDVGASNVRVTGMKFVASADSTARCLDADSGFSGFRFDNNLVTWSGTNKHDFRVMLRLSQKNAIIEDNRFITEDTCGTGRGIAINGYCDNLIIRRNYFYGMYDTLGDTSGDIAGAIALDSAYDSGDTDLFNADISENVIVSTDTGSATEIVLAGGGTTVKGIVRENKIVSFDTAQVDTVGILYGACIPMRNLMINGDSDTTLKVVEWSLQAP